MLVAGSRLLTAPAAAPASRPASGVAEAALILQGQSNAGFATSDKAHVSMAAGVGWYLSAANAAYGAWSGTNSPGTAFSGIGIYEIVTPTNFGLTFLANTTGGGSPTVADAAAAPLGTCGTDVANFVSGNAGIAATGVQGIITYWGETDALEYHAATQDVYQAACERWMVLFRGMLGDAAAAIPYWWLGPPYAADDWVIRQAWAQLAADPAQNAAWLVRQTSDSNTRGTSWDATTGYVTLTASDVNGHRDAPDNIYLFNRGCLAAARSILASKGLADVLPASLGSGFGPQVASATLSGNIVTVTVQHDAGTDLKVPLLASQGVGWCVMDGGDLTAAGPLILATACERLSGTQLKVTLASAPSNPPASCWLYYPLPGAPRNPAQPNAVIGRGCAVTDNWSTISAASGAWDIAGALGSTYGRDLPLQPPMTYFGSGASTVATYGMRLS